MLTISYRTWLPVFFAAALLSSCASLKTKEVNHLEARQDDCEIQVFTDAREVNSSYEVVCEIESMTGSALYVKRTAQAAIDRAKLAACRCGADALLVISSGRRNVKFFAWRQGIATVQAIKINHSASN